MTAFSRPALSRFLILYAALYAGFGVQSPYLPSFLESRGLRPEAIALVLAAGSAARLVAGPAAGRLADRLDAPKVILSLCSAVAALIALGYLPARGLWLLFAVGVVHKFNPYYTINYLMDPRPEKKYVCNYRTVANVDPLVEPLREAGLTPAKSSPLITEDEDGLGISEWLWGAMFADKLLHSVTGPEKLPTKAQLDDERQVLRESGFIDQDITQIVASGMFPSIPELKKQLSALKEGGYTTKEIIQIVLNEAKASTSGGGGGGGGGSSPKPDTVSIEIKFIIVSSGNVTPQWKLVRVSANTGSTPLVNLGRTRTHDLVITIGPPTQATQNTFASLENGQTIGANFRSNASSVTPTTNTPLLPFLPF